MRYALLLLSLLTALVPIRSSAQQAGDLTGADYKRFPEDYGRRARKHFENTLGMRYIPSQTFTMGTTEAPNDANAGKLTGAISGSARRQVSIAGYWLCEREVSNYDYRMYVEDIRERFGEDSATTIMPDTSVWDNDTIMSPHMAGTYFSHPAFDNYPVVGVSYWQANAYCVWLSEQLISFLNAEGEDTTGVPNFRLPTEAEWEAAASMKPASWGEDLSQPEFATENGLPRRDKDLELHLNCGGTQDATGYFVLSYYDDGFYETAPHDAFAPNVAGIRHLSGNVAEWCVDVYKPIKASSFSEGNKIMRGIERLYRNLQTADNEKVVKGGAWTNPLGALRVGLRQSVPATTQSVRIGFRVAMTSTNPQPVTNY